MIVRKKGQGLSMTVIVVAILALVILVILLLVLTGRLALFGGAAQECPGKCSGAGQSCEQAFGPGWTELGPGHKYTTDGKKCEGDCCISVTAVNST